MPRELSVTDQPFQELSVHEMEFERRDVQDPIAIEASPTESEAGKVPRPPTPFPTIRSFVLPANDVAVMIEPPRPFRRVVTILSPQQAMTCEVSYDRLFRAPDYGVVAANLTPIPVFPEQPLYARQNAGADLPISVLMEPRGQGR